MSHIYAGTWVPRTQVHLQEYHRFLATKSSHLPLNSDILKHFHRKLKPQNITYQKSTIDSLSAKLKQLDFSYLEDGTIILSKPLQEFQKDFDHLASYLLDPVLKSFSYLYSKGAPIPKVFTGLESIVPLIVTLTRASQQTIDSLFKFSKDQITHIEKDKNLTAYFGNSLVVLVGKNTGGPELIRFLIFLQEHKNQLEKLLNIHRTTWDQITKIRERQKLKFKDLPQMRDQLLNLKKDISYFDSRLEQMDIFAKERLNYAEKILPKRSLQSYCKNELASLLSTQEYLTDLWQMTIDYADQTLELIHMLYQDNEQKELNMLQVIFLTSAIAGILSLGAMPGAVMIQKNLQGEIIGTTNVVSFSLWDMTKFGLIAAIGSLALYYTLHYAFQRLRSFRVIDMGRSTSQTVASSIKKHLSV